MLFLYSWLGVIIFLLLQKRKLFYLASSNLEVNCGSRIWTQLPCSRILLFLAVFFISTLRSYDCQAWGLPSKYHLKEETNVHSYNARGNNIEHKIWSCWRNRKQLQTNKRDLFKDEKCDYKRHNKELFHQQALYLARSYYYIVQKVLLTSLVCTFLSR